MFPILSAIADDCGCEECTASRLPPPLPEAQVMELKELFEAYRESRVSPKFSPGEIIIARSNVGIGNAGVPCVVLEVREGAEISFAGGPEDYGSNQFGKRNDIRIACWIAGDYCPFWDESWKYVRYIAPRATMEDGDDA